MTSRLRHLLSKYKGYIFLGLIILLALKVFIPQLSDLRASITALRGTDLRWIAAGILVFWFGLPILTWQYLALALKPLRFGLTLKVEVAGLFVSKLLPSSLGTISLNYYYFLKEKHTAIQAGTVMAMNGITSGIGYAILMVLALTQTDYHVGSIVNDISIPFGAIFIVIGLFALGIMVALRVPKVKHKVASTIKDISKNLKAYRSRSWSVVWAIFYNAIGSMTSLFALYASAHSLGVSIGLGQTLLAYTLGNIAAGLIPTPGGIGAAEAGIYSGLVLVGVDSSEALVITLVYRLITYWIPILPGYLSFASLRKNVLVNFRIKQPDTTPKQL